MAPTNDTAQRTNLHIGNDQTVISIDGQHMQTTVLVLPLGQVKTGRKFFKHEPPTPLEIEHAIEVVEDELFRVRESVPGGSALYSADETIRQIANAAGIGDQREAVLSRDDVEKAFDRLAALAMGRPITQDGIPTNPEFAATLLILREFMHHLQFSSIAVTTEIY